MRSFNHIYQDQWALESFAKSHAHEIDSASDILITVFSGEMQPEKIRLVLSELRNLFPKAHISGATSAGEIHGESISEGVLAIGLHCFKKTRLMSHYIPLNGANEMAEDCLDFVAPDCKGLMLLPVVVGNYFDIELFLELIYGSQPHLPIFGGAAGEKGGTYSSQYVISGIEIHDSGISFVTFNSDELEITTDYSFNWQGVGRYFCVTEADGNRIKKIDHLPATSVIRDYLGDEAVEHFPELGMEFPLIFKQKGVKMARVITGVEQDEIILAAPVEEGKVFQFSFGSRDEALAHSRSLALKYQDQKVESIMAFSCIARLNFLQKEAHKELAHLSRKSNLTGFFTYGEIYHSDKSNYYLNETLTLVFFNEGVEEEIESVEENGLGEKQRSKEDSRLKVLTHLVSKVTSELERKNDELAQNNRILREYSKVIDERNMEIRQSLRYASKLQNSIVFQNEEFDRLFKDHFILFKPKEQVSGDFYFIRDLGKKMIIAVADGTGHGVPGAFISILGVQIMHSITRRMKMDDANYNAAEFLNMLRDKMKKVLDRNRMTKFSTDGLDISLVILNKESNEMDFAGANQSVVICCDDDMIQLKGDRMPVGAFVNEKSFSNTSVSLKSNSKVFMYTDGYADQFGGGRGKKLNSATLRKLIREKYDLPMDTMKYEMDDHFEQWKGGWEQTDDVLMLGFNV